ncbi:MAG: hypothetical protein CSB24_02700 [Deltaproteobacteria bacterium]|nr:MAG: hypothetical protein CSB24_02700 [Deltaproteobacteria bacterium]
MYYILEQLIGSLKMGEQPILAVIVKSDGSSPRKAGARMLILPDGSICGSIGGGMVEKECRRKAGEIFAGLRNFVYINFDHAHPAAGPEGMVCSGSVTVLLQRVMPDDLSVFTKLYQGCKGQEKLLLITRLPKYDGKAEEPPEFIRSDELPKEIAKIIAEQNKGDGRPFIAATGENEFLIEPISYPGTLYIMGAGHVSQAVAYLASYAGFAVVVMDDRPEFASKARFPEAKQLIILPDFKNCLSGQGAGDYVVIAARSHAYDRDALEQALKTRAGYIGMIGSLKKRNVIYGQLEAKGFTKAELARVHCPIGLPIAAETPAEIGVSIVAELIQARAAYQKLVRDF